MIVVLTGLVASAAEPAAPAQPAAPVDTPAPVDAPAACFPDCSPGYLCHQGTCIQACNPTCPDTERCTAERICVPRAPAAPAPVGVGELCVLRESNFVASAARIPIEVDGLAFGTVGNGRVLCEPVAAGEHQVTLQLGDVEHHFPLTIVADETSYLQWSVQNMQRLAPVSSEQGERLRLALRPADPKHRSWRAPGG